MQNDTCVWPKCYNRRWAARGLPVCGDCAQIVAYAMSDRTKAEEVRDRIHQLEHLVLAQERTIASLRGPQPEPNVRAKQPVDGTVYYVQVGSRIKIGWTSNMGTRMKSYPPDSTLLAQHPGTRKDEQRMHRRFATDRTHGREWYVPSVSLTHHIEQVVREHGTPDPVPFRAQPLTVRRPSGSRPTGAMSTRLGRAV